MEKAIELGIGFVTGRANVCKIINNYFKEMRYILKIKI